MFIQALTIQASAYVTYSKLKILQLAVLDYFLQVRSQKHFLSFMNMWSNFKKLGINVL